MAVQSTPSTKDGSMRRAFGADRTPCHATMLGGAWKCVREADIEGAVRWLAVNCHLRPFCGCGRYVQAVPLKHTNTLSHGGHGWLVWTYDAKAKLHMLSSCSQPLIDP